MGRAVVGLHDRRDRLRHRRPLLPRRRGAGRRHRACGRARRASRSTTVRGRRSRTRNAPSTCVPWVRRSRRAPTRSPNSGRASRERSMRLRSTRAMGMQKDFDAYAALADTFPFEEPATPLAGRLRAPRARAGRHRRRDRPVEQPARSHPAQDRPRAARGLHGRPEDVARGAGRRLPRRGSGGGDRAAARRAQRR